MWIGFSVDHRADVRSDNRFGAGRCTPVVAAWLKRDVERAAESVLSGHLDGGDFGMGFARFPMMATSHNNAGCINDDAADERVGLSATVPTHGKLGSVIEPVLVNRYVCRGYGAHVWASTSSLRLGGMTRYSEGSIVELARPWVMPRSTVV